MLEVSKLKVLYIFPLHLNYILNLINHHQALLLQTRSLIHFAEINTRNKRSIAETDLYDQALKRDRRNDEERSKQLG